MINRIQSGLIYIDNVCDYLPLLPLPRAAFQNPVAFYFVSAINAIKLLSVMFCIILQNKNDFDFKTNPFLKHIYHKSSLRCFFSIISLVGPVLVLLFEKVIKPYFLAEIKEGRLDIVKKFGSALDYDMVYAAIDQNKTVFKELPYFWQTDYRICLRLINKDPNTLEWMNSYMRYYSFVAEKAIHQDLSSLCHVNPFCRPHFYIASRAIEHDPEALQYIKSFAPNYLDLARKAVWYNSLSYVYVENYIPSGLRHRVDPTIMWYSTGIPQKRAFIPSGLLRFLIGLNQKNPDSPLCRSLVQNRYFEPRLIPEIVAYLGSKPPYPS